MEGRRQVSPPETGGQGEGIGPGARGQRRGAGWRPPFGQGALAFHCRATARGAGHIPAGQLLEEEAGDVGAVLVRVGDGQNGLLQLLLREEGNRFVDAAGVQVVQGRPGLRRGFPGQRRRWLGSAWPPGSARAPR